MQKVLFYNNILTFLNGFKQKPLGRFIKDFDKGVCMMHWGWYWAHRNKEHVSKKLCSKLAQIDSFKVYQKGLSVGFEVKPFDILAIPMLDHLKITYRKQKRSSYCINVEQKPCNYGGVKTYFKCPLCDSRMRILYLAANSVFLCRKCLNLGYVSQRYRPSIRCMMQETKIKELIINFGGDLSKNHRPRYMHRKTFEKMQGKATGYELKWHKALKQEALAWYGEKAIPYLENEL